MFVCVCMFCVTVKNISIEFIVCFFFIRTMAAQCDRPIIMPMSNPNSRCECSAEEAYRWSDGRAIVATGSPFPPVTLTTSDGRTQTLVASQCNNMYVFPGLGLAASVGGISKITDQMLYEAAVACAKSMTADEVAEGRTFPSVKRIREVSLAVACAVIREGMQLYSLFQRFVHTLKHYIFCPPRRNARGLSRKD